MIKVVIASVRFNLVQKRLLSLGVPATLTLEQLAEYLKKITNVELQRLLDLIDFESRW